MRIRILFLLALILPGSAFAAPQKPRLVVVLSIDQFRADYLTRFEHLLLPARLKNGKPGGLRFFTEQGAYFTNGQAWHQLPTTGVGHAAISTGAFPYLHGIVSHRWYDAEKAKTVYCVEDDSASLVGPPGATFTGGGYKGGEDGAGRSPRALLVTSIGDELKNAFGGKPVVASVALKDRASILMGGQRADLTIWFNESAKSWVTSTYYAKSLPEWLVRFKAEDYRKSKVPAQWTKLLADDAYTLSLADMPETAVAGARSLGKTFPHPITDLAGFITSPWGMAYTLDTALEAVKSMKLGSDATPDLLTIGLSSFDMLGHNFGPVSVEMQDAALRADRMISEFLGKLDELIPGGLKNTVLVLTADHGITINPALTGKLKLPGGIYYIGEWTEKANAFLRARFGFGGNEKPVVSMKATNAWLHLGLVAKRGLDANAVARALAEWLRSQPFIAAAYARADLLEGKVPPTIIGKKMAVSVHPTRSGDVVYAPRPGFVALPDNTTEGSDHSSPAVHDSTVPIAFVGAAFKPGRYPQEVKLNDIVPTLSTVLGIIAPSGSEGRVLSDALK